MPLNAAELILARSMESAIRVRPALLFGGKVITYAELHGLVNRTANAFLGLGVARGERVPLLLNDGPLYVAAILALMKIGAVVIPLNTKLKPEEYKFIAADCGARLMVVDNMYAESVAEVAGVKLLAASGGPDSLTKRVDSASSHATFAVLDAEDPCFWLYSSGTTGMPKGIIHTQRGASESSKVMREVLRFDETAVVFCTSKLFFAFALDNGLLGVLRIGAATVLNEAWPDAETIVAQVASIQPDVFLTVPTFFRRLLQLGEAKLAPFRAVPFYVTGGERVPDSVALKWQEVTGHEILPCHGMSETFCNNFCNFPGQVRLGSCGFALASVEPLLLPRGARPGEEIADAIAAGEPGVLWVRHPSLAARYNNEEKTAESFVDGWFCTKDQFRVDADGYWFHEGRADELLKVAGQWVKPQEIEDAVLGDHVREAACVVVADADGFERLALYVVPNHAGSVQSLAEEQARAGLPAHSWPKWVRSIDELPRTPTGKVQKFKLKELLQAELFPPAAPQVPAEPTDAPPAPAAEAPADPPAA
jgi:benzoate-CoA ligase